MLKQTQILRNAPALFSSAAMAALLWAAPALAQTAPSGPTAQPKPDKAVETLVHLLVLEGVITPEKGDALMRRAIAEAAASEPAPTQASAVAAVTELAPPPAGAVRVAYVPEPVREQIKQELRGEVMAQAKSEGWSAPGTAAPGWVNNVKITGDFRFRSASAFYNEDNAQGFYVDVPAFNSTGPYDVASGSQLLPQINTTRNKVNNMQIRARMGLEATIADNIKLGFQLATGDNAGPISTNSSLAGGFAKRDLWLQNAYAKAELLPGLTAMVGRFDNPFMTTDLMFDPDLALDGAYGEFNFARRMGWSSTILAVRGGAFPIQFESANYPETSSNKRNWRDRYLYSAQVEVGKTFNNQAKVYVSAAYHDFTYLRGHVSRPCDVFSASNVECSTDMLRPLYATKGNTLMYLRRIDTTFADDPANPANPQYLGLKFAYRVLDLNGSVSYPMNNGQTVKLTGTYLHNFGFDPKNICKEGQDGQPLNNVELTDPLNNPLQGACDATKPAKFVGGNDGYGVYVSLGDPALFNMSARNARRNAWAINLGYKYLESDAVPDSFTDSDFHLGGTNARGFTINGSWAPYDRVTIGGRWISANQIVDAPLKIDVLQLDLGVAF